jgi:uncharacterized membrane protein
MRFRENWLATAVVASVITFGAAASRAEDPANTSECEILVTAPLESEVVDATDHGSYLLSKWVKGELGHEIVFFWKNGEMEKALPQIDGYTHTLANGLSADDSVLCTALGHANGSLKNGMVLAFVWNPQTDQVIHLPYLDGYQASYGGSISHDGKSVCGFQFKAGSGNVPVVWTKNAEGKWICEKLPVIYDDNPRMTTAGIKISPNGKIIVAPITVDIIPSALNPYVSDMHLWTKGDDGSWTREFRTKNGLVVHAVNDHGAFVGQRTFIVNGAAYPRAYVCTIDKGLQEIGVLYGDIASDACDINNRGIVVGWSTDPYGPTDPEKDLGYDDPFVWTATGGIRKIIVASTPSKGAHGSVKTITEGNRIGGRVTVVDELNEPAFTAVLQEGAFSLED